MPLSSWRKVPRSFGCGLHSKAQKQKLFRDVRCSIYIGSNFWRAQRRSLRHPTQMRTPSQELLNVLLPRAGICIVQALGTRQNLKGWQRTPVGSRWVKAVLCNICLPAFIVSVISWYQKMPAPKTTTRSNTCGLVYPSCVWHQAWVSLRHCLALRLCSPHATGPSKAAREPQIRRRF